MSVAGSLARKQAYEEQLIFSNAITQDLFQGDEMEPPTVMPSWYERHYSPKEFGVVLNLSHDSVIRLIKNEPGVLKFCPPHRRGVRRRVTYRIPESVATRIYKRCRNQ